MYRKISLFIQWMQIDSIKWIADDEKGKNDEMKLPLWLTLEWIEKTALEVMWSQKMRTNLSQSNRWMEEYTGQASMLDSELLPHSHDRHWKCILRNVHEY